MASTRKPTGYIIHRGPSLLDGQPIVVIALTGSTNRKTGDMVQTYILRSDVHPIEAAKDGRDASICGDCKHRPSAGGACYVTLAHGPSVVYKAFKAGNYPDVSGGPLSIAQLGAGRMVRLGTYGDPAAVPMKVWDALLNDSTGRTGYTHQWHNPAVLHSGLLRYVMASVDNEAEAESARYWGLRYFRIRASVDQPMGPREFVCPASDEAGKRKTCIECGACDGTQREGQASPVIVAHGSKAKRFIAIHKSA